MHARADDGIPASAVFDFEMKKRHIQFSKILTGVFASVMLPVSIYVIYQCISLAELAISNGFTGALPYITAIIGFVESSVTIVLGFYYKNSEREKVALAQYGKRDY